MRSSISNSDASCWRKCWLLALFLLVAAVGALELSWRFLGHTPNVVDDQKLWAIERSKVGSSEKEVVLLGASRMETDISMTTLQALLPGYKIINLAIDGSCANIILRDLAADKNFRGLLLVDITSECILFGDGGEFGTQSYVDYYRKQFSLNSRINREIATSIQKRLTVVNPYLDPRKVTGDLLLKKQMRKPNYVQTFEDRSRLADYEKLDIAAHKEKRLQKVQNIYRKYEGGISGKAFADKTKALEMIVEQIAARGGKVVFVRFPVSDEHWDIDEEVFPRAKYWDNFASVTKAEVIHFMDNEKMRNISCPDTSHLDFRDTAEFTRLLVIELIKRKVI